MLYVPKLQYQINAHRAGYKLSNFSRPLNGSVLVPQAKAKGVRVTFSFLNKISDRSLLAFGLPLVPRLGTDLI